MMFGLLSIRKTKKIDPDLRSQWERRRAEAAKQHRELCASGGPEHEINRVRGRFIRLTQCLRECPDRMAQEFQIYG